MKRKAGEIEVGWMLAVPGAELHDDLAGLTCWILVERIEKSGTGIIVFDSYGKTETWFGADELVEVTSFGKGTA